MASLRPHSPPHQQRALDQLLAFEDEATHAGYPEMLVWRNHEQLTVELQLSQDRLRQLTRQRGLPSSWVNQFLRALRIYGRGIGTRDARIALYTGTAHFSASRKNFVTQLRSLTAHTQPAGSRNPFLDSHLLRNLPHDGGATFIAAYNHGYDQAVSQVKVVQHLMQKETGSATRLSRTDRRSLNQGVQGLRISLRPTRQDARLYDELIEEAVSNYAPLFEAAARRNAIASLLELRKRVIGSPEQQHEIEITLSANSEYQVVQRERQVRLRQSEIAHPRYSGLHTDALVRNSVALAMKAGIVDSTSIDDVMVASLAQEVLLAVTELAEASAGYALTIHTGTYGRAIKRAADRTSPNETEQRLRLFQALDRADLELDRSAGLNPVIPFEVEQAGFDGEFGDLFARAFLMQRNAGVQTMRHAVDSARKILSLDAGPQARRDATRVLLGADHWHQAQPNGELVSQIIETAQRYEGASMALRLVKAAHMREHFPRQEADMSRALSPIVETATLDLTRSPSLPL